jgi:hypothetical protein
MDAIYFGSSCWFKSTKYNCSVSGAGPWVQADLEYGIFAWNSSQAWNANEVSFTSPYVTAMLKNDGTKAWALKGGNAQSGGLTTLWDGALPPGYSPMKKQGAIILGSGGDCCANNTNQSEGTFYEGALVAGYPSNATDDAVQANIAQAGYGSNSVGLSGSGRDVPAFHGGFLLAAGPEMGLGNLPHDGLSRHLEARDLAGKRIAEGYLSTQGRPVWTAGSPPNGAYLLKVSP